LAGSFTIVGKKWRLQKECTYNPKKGGEPHTPIDEVSYPQKNENKHEKGNHVNYKRGSRTWGIFVSFSRKLYTKRCGGKK